MKSKIPKIISGIAATISVIVIAFFLLSSFWFWVLFEIFAALSVAIGCSGEWYLHHHPAGRKKREKDRHHILESRFIGAVVLGVTMEFFALGHTIREGVKLENDIAIANERVSRNVVRVTELTNEVVRLSTDLWLAKSNSLVLQTNFASLNLATLRLARQYDLSTNALAEAKARLASIKPLKERIIDWFNRINPTILQKLKSGETTFELDAIPEREFFTLKNLFDEQGSLKYVLSIKDKFPNQTNFAPGGRYEWLIVVLNPALEK